MITQSLPKDRLNDYTNEIITKRVAFLEKISKADLTAINQFTVNPELTRGNIENIIGFTQIPIGVIGPLLTNGEHAKGEFYVPMATLEGALISSYNRGARVISQSGGANVVIMQDTIQRAPFFVFKNINKAKEFIVWFRLNFDRIKEVAARTTAHGKLHSFKSFLIGKNVYVRLEFSSGDAMGMNMITKATNEICNYVAENIEVEKCVIESNMAVDKKPAYINMILGRGKSVSAEIQIPEKLVNRYFMTTPRKIVDNYRDQMLGNTLAGVNGCTYHFANGLAAIFIACGQDAANVADSCTGITNMEIVDDDLYVSIYLPSLILGTIGGGTSLPAQKSCLDIMGCSGKNKVKKFTEIVAASLLCGEISLAAAITAGDFVEAHEKYGRNRPIDVNCATVGYGKKNSKKPHAENDHLKPVHSLVH